MVEALEEVIDVLTRKVKNNHIRRVQSGNCTLELGFIFNDCLNNIESVADHCSNIGVAVLEVFDPHVHAHGYLKTLKENAGKDFQTLMNDYTIKYAIEESETESQTDLE